MRQWIKELVGISCAKAGALQEGLNTAAGQAELQTDKALPEIIGTILNVIIGFVGVIFLVLIIYGGFMWMFAGGKEDRATKAKGAMVNGAVGLIIVLAAYGILKFIFDRLGIGQ